MALDIIDHAAMYENTQAIINTIKNVNDWQRYARELEERISKLEVKLKETGDSAIKNWFMSLSRKAIIVAGDLWLQKYGEVPVHPDVLAAGKNQFENHIEKSDETFLALVSNVLKLIVASESNSKQSKATTCIRHMSNTQKQLSLAF
jgi:hypothetical protein